MHRPAYVPQKSKRRQVNLGNGEATCADTSVPTCVNDHWTVSWIHLEIHKHDIWCLCWCGTLLFTSLLLPLKTHLQLSALPAGIASVAAATGWSVTPTCWPPGMRPSPSAPIWVLTCWSLTGRKNHKKTPTKFKVAFIRFCPLGAAEQKWKQNTYKQ